MQQWFEIQLDAPDDLREPIINRLFELGAAGVNESQEGSRTISGFFDEEHRETVNKDLPPYLSSLAEIFPALPKVALTLRDVVNENWAERHKEFYRAQKLTRLFFLMPAWDKETEVPDGMIPIVMEPGQAFGTGLHASTNLSLRLLEFTVDLFPQVEKLSVLDVGTGTGILAIAAAKLGAGKVAAFDVDPIAAETAADNCVLNGCGRIAVATAETSAYEGPFDIVISNILLETHRELAGEYRRLVAPQGQVILAGLLAPQRAEIDEAMTAQGFVLETSEASQEWIALVYRRT